MEMKKMLLAAISIVIILLAVTVVNASPGAIVNTSLFTYRMEQHSSEMSFSPAETNTFAYTAEKGFNLDYEVTGYIEDADPLADCSYYATTCHRTCPRTCKDTCPYTCGYTHWWSCKGTCRTCPYKPCNIALLGS